ncbi:MAG: hypothetical protein MZV70_73135 [Desulfobacterales bacterium]|nr:hypothetical protein [Desulfobacterales bacterium]
MIKTGVVGFGGRMGSLIARHPPGEPRHGSGRGPGRQGAPGHRQGCR